MTIYATNPGKYRHRIEFQEQVETRDDNGGVVLTWQTVEGLSSVPAEVLTGPGRELVAANAQQAETVARINCRWFPGLQATWRILWDGHVYNIRPPETDSTARREYRIQCTDGVNDGR